MSVAPLNRNMFFGVILQGAFGIGGPFVVSAIRGELKNKLALRAIMAVFFVSFNVICLTQLSLQW